MNTLYTFMNNFRISSGRSTSLHCAFMLWMVFNFHFFQKIHFATKKTLELRTSTVEKWYNKFHLSSIFQPLFYVQHSLATMPDLLKNDSLQKKKSSTRVVRWLKFQFFYNQHPHFRCNQIKIQLQFVIIIVVVVALYSVTLATAIRYNNIYPIYSHLFGIRLHHTEWMWWEYIF